MSILPENYKQTQMDLFLFMGDQPPFWYCCGACREHYFVDDSKLAPNPLGHYQMAFKPSLGRASFGKHVQSKRHKDTVLKLMKLLNIESPESLSNHLHSNRSHVGKAWEDQDMKQQTHPPPAKKPRLVGPTSSVPAVEIISSKTVIGQSSSASTVVEPTSSAVPAVSQTYSSASTAANSPTHVVVTSFRSIPAHTENEENMEDDTGMHNCDLVCVELILIKYIFLSYRCGCS